MPRFHALSIGLAGAALSATMLFAGSHAADNPAVKARQAQMQLYAFNLGTLGAMAQEKVAYDADAAAMAAKNVAAIADLEAAPMCPAGTGADGVAGPRALPDIWSNFPDVAQKAQAMQAAADAMVAAASVDLASLQGAMGALGGACGACHKAYRVPE